MILMFNANDSTFDASPVSRPLSLSLSLSPVFSPVTNSGLICEVSIATLLPA